MTITVTNDLKAHPFLHILNIIAAALSLLGSSFMIAYCLRIKQRTTALKFTLSLSISDFIYTISNIMSIFYSYQENSAYCDIEGFIRQTALMFSIFSPTCTAVLCYKDSKYSKEFNQDRFFRKAIPAGVLVCLCFGLSPFMIKHIGYAEDRINCSVVYHDQSDQLMSSIVFSVYLGIPILLGVVVSLIGYMKAIQNYKEMTETFLGSSQIYVYKLLWYPAVMVIIFLPNLVDRILETYASGIIVSEAFHIVFMYSMGFANALVYGLQRGKLSRVVETESLQVNRLEYMSGITNSLSRGLIGANGSEVERMSSA